MDVSAVQASHTPSDMLASCTEVSLLFVELAKCDIILAVFVHMRRVNKLQSRQHSKQQDVNVGI